VIPAGTTSHRNSKISLSEMTGDLPDRIFSVNCGPVRSGIRW
jgi:hypothetical protein